jgi:geranylgeranyl diphosphate synthase, type I
MSLPDIFQRYRNDIDSELLCVFEGLRLPFYDMLRYHLGWIDENGHPTSQSNGKALRSTLCLLACESISGGYKKALPAAAALELVHNFSLIHDDIQDNDRERRHRPTVWVVYGIPQAINAGTAMRVLANVSMMRLREQGVPENRILEALQLLDQSSLRLIEGQHLDLSFEKRQQVGINEYLNMIELKTVSLISCALALGAMLVAEKPEVILPFLKYGNNLGFAFQIRDDVLGIWGDEKVTGKPAGSDILRRKKSYPIVFAWEHSTTAERKELSTLYQDAEMNGNGRDHVLEILERTGARLQAQELIGRYCGQALSEIEGAPLDSNSRLSFQELVHFLDIREF